MSGDVGVGGAWKEMVNGTAVGVGGVWKNISNMWVGVGGTWKEWFVAAVYALPTGGIDQGASSGTNSSSINTTFNTNGTFTTVGENAGTIESGNWVTPTSLAPGSYTIRASLAFGTAPSGDTLDTDHALSSARSWALSQSGVGSKTCELTLTLKDGGGNTVASGTLSLTAEVLPI